MKKTILLMLILIPLSFIYACDDSSSSLEDEDDNGANIPDLFFSMEATGAENFEIEFELQGGVADEFSANGAWTSNVQLLQIIVLDLTPGWQFAINAFNDVGVEEGTYELNVTTEGTDISTFLNADQTQTYFSIGGEVTITNAEEFVRPGPGATDFIDGTFTVDFVDADAFPGVEPTMTITGEFRGISIGSNFIN